MTVVTDIPQASTLHAQLTLLMQAVDTLENGGAIVSLGMAAPPPAPGAPGPPAMAGSTVGLSPPITNPDTINAVVEGLNAQAFEVTKQLNALGYDVSAVSAARGWRVPPGAPDETNRA